MQKLSNPQPIFLDASGMLLDAGHIYVGVANADPQTQPIDLFWDKQLSKPAVQPLRTLGGLIVNGTTPASVFYADGDFSMRVTDAADVLVFYSPSIYSSDGGVQPLDADLTAIAAQGTTSFGRSLLLLANQADLVAATGIPTPLPAAGGAVSGNIVRQGAGSHLYWAASGLTSGRVFHTASGAGDPTSQPGDIWLELQ